MQRLPIRPEKPFGMEYLRFWIESGVLFVRPSPRFGSTLPREGVVRRPLGEGLGIDVKGVGALAMSAEVFDGGIELWI